MAKSRMSVKGVEALKVALDNLASTASSTTFSVMLAGAKAIQKKARMYAPVDKHNLEKSIQIERVESETTGRKAINVGVDESMVVPHRPSKTVGDYAKRMHEGSYNLGEKSLKKQKRLGVVVGRKYLQRAMKEEKAAIQTRMEQAILVTTARANARRGG